MLDDAKIRRDLRAALDAHSLHDMTSLGEAIGKRKGYISSFFAGRGNPDFITFMKMCAELGLDPIATVSGDSLLNLQPATPLQQEVDKQAMRLLKSVTDAVASRMAIDNREFSIDDLIIWWHENSGKLHSMDQFAEYVDLIHAPNHPNEVIRPHRLGAKSLASEALFSNDPNKLARFLDSITEEERMEISWSYHQAALGPSTAVPSVVVDMEDMDQPNHLKYYRLLLPVEDAMGNKLILNYSREIE